MNIFKRFLKNNMAYSLVELIVTIAIMSIVTAGIGAAIVSATRNYSKGTTEVSIQTNAQNITNIITNMIIDSADAAGDKDGNQTNSSKALFITSIDSAKCYAIWFVAGPEGSQGEGKLYYGEGATYAAACNDSTKLLLAENVSNFDIDTSKYSTDYSVHVTMDLYYAGTQRAYQSSFTVVSRNAAAGSSIIKNLDGAAIICDSMTVIEPNEDGNTKSSVNLDCKVVTSGSVTDASINYMVLTKQPVEGETLVDASTTCNLEVTYASNKFILKAKPNSTLVTDSNGCIYLYVRTNAKDVSGNPYDTKLITIFVREVTNAAIDKDATLSSSTTNKKNSKHVITGKVTAINPERFYALPADNDYASVYDNNNVSIYDVIWTVSCSSGSVSDYINSVTNDEGVNVLSSMLGEGYKCKSGDTFTAILSADLPKGKTIKFIMKPTHPLGKENLGGKYTNKASFNTSSVQEYPCVAAEYTITSSLFDIDGDYRRGKVLNGDGLSSGAADSIYKDLFANVHKKYKKLAQQYPNGVDENGNKYDDVVKYLDKWEKGEVHENSDYNIGYFYRILSYEKRDGQKIDPETNKEAVWSQYRSMGSSATNYDFTTTGTPVGGTSGTLQGGMTNRLAAGCYQDVEFVCVIYHGNTILWPNYETLLDYGFGPNDEEHHWGINWSISNMAKSITEDYSSYASTFQIVPATISYYSKNPKFGVYTPAELVGTTDHPIILGENINEIELEYDQENWVGLQYQAYQNMIGSVLMRKESKTSGSWVKYGIFSQNSEFNSKYGTNSYIQVDQAGFKVWGTNHSFKWGTQNLNNVTDKNAIYRVAGIICGWKLGFINEKETMLNADGSWNKTIYWDSQHIYDYLLCRDAAGQTAKISDPVLNGSVTFKRYGDSEKTLTLDYGDGRTSTITYMPGKQISFPEDPTREGFIFAGWYTAGGVQIFPDTTNINVNILYAQWVDGNTVYTTEFAETTSYNRWDGVKCQVYEVTVRSYRDSSSLEVTVEVSDDSENGYQTAGHTEDGNIWKFNLNNVRRGQTYTFRVDIFGGEIVSVY